MKALTGIVTNIILTITKIYISVGQ